jgi:phosphoglycolate phosphatase
MKKECKSKQHIIVILSSHEMKLTTPKAILFDWHATLVDTLEAMYHAVDDVLLMFDELGLIDRLTEPQNSKNEEDAKLVSYVRDFQKLHPKLKADKKISRTDIFEVLFDLDSEAKLIAHREFNNCYRNHFGEIHPFEDGIEEMLSHFHRLGIKLGVLTNRDREFLEHEINVINVTGWGTLFDILVCGDDVINRKPAPDLILKGVNDLELTAGLDIWHVGDSTTDMAASEAAGVTSIFFNGACWDKAWLDKIFPGTDKHPHLPDAIINNFGELRELVDYCLPNSVS